MMRSDVVNAVLDKECEAIVLTDSSKFGAVHPYTMGWPRFSRVITDERLSDAHRIKLEEQDGLTVNIIKKQAPDSPPLRPNFGRIRPTFSEMILNPSL